MDSLFRVDERRGIKIADFGLARDIHQDDYYRIADRSRPMPIKWMAIESLDDGKFTTYSDVVSGLIMPVRVQRHNNNKTIIIIITLLKARQNWDVLGSSDVYIHYVVVLLMLESTGSLLP